MVCVREPQTKIILRAIERENKDPPGKMIKWGENTILWRDLNFKILMLSANDARPPQIFNFPAKKLYTFEPILRIAPDQKNFLKNGVTIIYRLRKKSLVSCANDT